MSKKSHNYEHSVKAIITSPDGRMLLLEKAKGPRGSHWDIPGGHANEGESQEVTLARETREEARLPIAELALSHVVRLEKQRKHGVKITDLVEVVSPYAFAVSDDELSAEHRSARWVPVEAAVGLLGKSAVGEGVGLAVEYGLLQNGRHEMAPETEILIA